MGSQQTPPSRDPPAVVRTELLHETARTRVTRLLLPAGSVIRKEPLGPGARWRLRHEVDILERLAGVEGVAHLAAAGPDGPALPAAELDGAGSALLADRGGVPLAGIGGLLLADVGGADLSRRATPMDPAELVDLAGALARAVAGMHGRGVLHRDISPANIVVNRAGNRPYLIDFALATTATEIQPGFAHHNEIVGTVPYLAPEQTGWTGSPVDQRADLYAVGATLYELATGAPPFGSGDPLRIIHDHLTRVPVAPSVVNPALPAGLSDVVMHLLEKEPDDRYQSAEGLALDLVLVHRGACVRPGEHDLPERPLTPSRLAGRERETGELRAAFTDAVAGRCRGILVAGAPGVGKTSLVNELRSIVAGAGGWFVTGKFDQYRRDQEYDGIRQALRALGRLLLAEPEGSLDEVRERLLGGLGPGAGLVAAVVPELAALLRIPPMAGDPMTAQVRAQRAAVEVLRAVASRERPLVIFVDDLQWAGRTPLGVLDLILGGEQEHEGLLVVGAYRDDEVDATHPMAPMLARWRRQPAGPRHLRLRNLPPPDQAAMVTDLLRLPPERGRQLARLIAPATGGNPYDTVELVNSLRHDGLLTRVAGRWRWAPETLRARLARADVIELLRARVAALAPPAREALAAAACLAGQVDFELLAAATGQAAWELERRLAPAFARGLLVLETDGRRGVRFRHDRAQEAVLAGLTGPAERALRLALARRLTADLLRRAADEATLLSNYPLAERLLAAAVAFTDPVDLDQLIEVHTGRHAALYMLGRLEDADEEYETLGRLCADPARRTAATLVQVSSLTNRGRAGAALSLGYQQLRWLGLAIPERDDLDGEIDRGLDTLDQWLERTTTADDLRRARGADRAGSGADLAGSGAVELINRLMPAAFFEDQQMLAWLTIQTLRMWIRDGPGPALAGPAGHAGFVAVAWRDDYRTGWRALRRIIEVCRARGYEPALWQVRFLYVLGTGHWFDPLEENVDAARRALEGLIRGGDLQNACWTHYALVYGLFDCAPSLDVVAAEVDEALAFAACTGNGHAEETFRMYRHLTDVLRGAAGPPAADGTSDLGRLGAELLAANPLAAAQLHITRAVAAAILDHPVELARHTAGAMAVLPAVQAHYSTVLARLLRSLALAGQARAAVPSRRAAVLAELDESIDWLAARAADAPSNYLHLLRLVEAERAWATGEFREAAYAYDVAQREAATRARPWHRALILERAARFYLAHGLEEAGHALLAAARRHYLAWGATAKVAQLDWAHPALPAGPVELTGPGGLTGPDAAGPAADAARPAPVPANASAADSPAGRRAVLTTGTIDLLGIVAASRTLSSETNVGGLRARVAGILSEMAGATGVHLLLRDQQDQGWLVPVGNGGSVPLPEAARRRLLPASVVRYAERTREPVVVADSIRDDRFCRDPYFTDIDRCSLLAVPLMIRGRLRAMLLLENRMIRGAFATERLEGIMLIAGQLAVSLDNALVYASLERKVAERTQQLAAANRRLEQLSRTDSLTGLANRRRLEEVLDAEWHRARLHSTPIALAMIDIDHFKLYNDHFGHTAGDRCLQRVAAGLAASLRPTHTAARFGGEEFAVVMPDTGPETAVELARHLRRAVVELAEPHPLVIHRIVTVSIGVAATIPAPGDEVAAFVERADVELYRAKRGGRDRVEGPLPRSVTR
ncbi:serine/threonine protein kinase [Parafrankia soli]|uniref:Serine/threonine protein kinase n=1 Tax=Parafrankia soli TaxID=2599596 RepID=A0A1S1PBS9_9ACTN|nr:diguanylate cyclase [Parafrankia soli]OHV18629.1 serine/threonine protein kinase [Parafrankia soli]